MLKCNSTLTKFQLLSAWRAAKQQCPPHCNPEEEAHVQGTRALDNVPTRQGDKSLGPNASWWPGQQDKKCSNAGSPSVTSKWIGETFAKCCEPTEMPFVYGLKPVRRAAFQLGTHRLTNPQPLLLWSTQQDQPEVPWGFFTPMGNGLKAALHISKPVSDCTQGFKEPQRQKSKKWAR